jgi:hypothetical protein
MVLSTRRVSLKPMDWGKEMGHLGSVGALGREMALFRAALYFSPQEEKWSMRIGKRTLFRASADGRWKMRNKPFFERPVQRIVVSGGRNYLVLEEKCLSVLEGVDKGLP